MRNYNIDAGLYQSKLGKPPVRVLEQIEDFVRFERLGDDGPKTGLTSEVQVFLANQRYQLVSGPGLN